MTSLADYASSTRTKVLVYGPPKAGKTALVGKLAEHFHLHFLDLESGIKTLLNPAMLDPKFRKNVTVANVPDHRTYPIAIDTVRTVLKGGARKICHTHGKIACPICAKLPESLHTAINVSEFTDKDILVIDSGSQLARSAMNKATLKEIQKPGGEEYKPTFTDYAVQGAQMEEILSLIQVSNLNVIMITHELESESLEGREKIVPVAGTRNFSLTCAKYFDAVVYCTVLNKKHKAYSSSTYSPTIITGSRLPIDIDTAADGGISLLPLFSVK